MRISNSIHPRKLTDIIRCHHLQELPEPKSVHDSFAISLWADTRPSPQKALALLEEVHGKKWAAGIRKIARSNTGNLVKYTLASYFSQTNNRKNFIFSEDFSKILLEADISKLTFAHINQPINCFVDLQGHTLSPSNRANKIYLRIDEKDLLPNTKNLIAIEKETEKLYGPLSNKRVVIAGMSDSSYFAIAIPIPIDLSYPITKIFDDLNHDVVPQLVRDTLNICKIIAYLNSADPDISEIEDRKEKVFLVGYGWQPPKHCYGKNWQVRGFWMHQSYGKNNTKKRLIFRLPQARARKSYPPLSKWRQAFSFPQLSPSTKLSVVR